VKSVVEVAAVETIGCEGATAKSSTANCSRAAWPDRG
jgi:hypothetical protein